MNESFLAEYLQDPENLRGFQRADLQVEIALQVERAMKQQKISRKALAERMGVSKGRITQILSGTSNLTLRLVADVFTALGLRLEIQPVALSEPRIAPPVLHTEHDAKNGLVDDGGADLKKQAS